MSAGGGRTTGTPDVVVVGSGPNGLAAALTLARAGLAVHVYEGAETPGGGCRTEELTLPGFVHDVCSTVHPLLAASPFFTENPLAGLSLKTPDIAFAHPLDGGRAAAVSGSVEQTATALGQDARAYRRIFAKLVGDTEAIVGSVLAPLLSPPAHPLAMGRFGLLGLWPTTVLARPFKTEEGRALLAGLGAHSMRPLGAPGTGAFALLLGVLAHAVGWPVVEGGSARIVDALLAELQSRGGQLYSGRPIGDLRELPRAQCALLDIAPRNLLELAGGQAPARYAKAMRRFKYGPGVFKMDWALDGAVPWQAEVCRSAPTLHIGGTFEEIARSESDVAAGRHSEQPFCIAVQPCGLDPTRAPAGKHTLYAYCHVPSGSERDMSERIEAQIERFAPGFRDLILARHSVNAVETERHNPNYVGGDINCGAATLRQTVFRPAPSLHPYRTAMPAVYLCSSATPPGGGVHGMCGQGAAREALNQLGL
ncbi:MAG TPA: NAD(P)/FAD-dependent oxidoreductase [Solirubrobacteraceae bacterium]|jgi:phytoene dehydrogenase-like protein|nr:NAD(P)/FAD-dependent oxidoreductase [Solirubrobacteraceae bacterium]